MDFSIHEPLARSQSKCVNQTCELTAGKPRYREA